MCLTDVLVCFHYRNISESTAGLIHAMQSTGLHPQVVIHQQTASKVSESHAWWWSLTFGLRFRIFNSVLFNTICGRRCWCTRSLNLLPKYQNHKSTQTYPTIHIQMWMQPEIKETVLRKTKAAYGLPLGQWRTSVTTKMVLDFTSPLSLRRDSFITLDIKDFFSVLMLNFAFLPWKLMVSHSQGFCSLCLAFVVFCQRFCSLDYKVLLTFSLKKVITG